MLITGENPHKPHFHSIKPVTAQHNYSTRHLVKNNYVLPQIKPNFGKKMFQYIGPKSWRELPSKLKTLPLNSFEKHYKNHLIPYYAN